MSEMHLKKQAKNAKILLPELLKEHSAEFTLSECQEFVARLSGYPSWHTALSSTRRKHGTNDDPIAAFYEYDWLKCSLGELLTDVGDPTKCKTAVQILTPGAAFDFISTLTTPQLPSEESILLVNAVGEDCGQAIDTFFEENANAGRIGTICYSKLGQRLGTTFDPLAKLTPQQVARLLSTVLVGVSSPAQSVRCYEVLELILSGRAEGHGDLLSLHSALSKLICLANGHDQGDDTLFYDVFPDRSRHDEAHALYALFETENFVETLRPIDALLSRLAVPNLDRIFNPRKSTLDGEHRDEIFKIHDFDSGIDHGLTIVDIDLGNSMLDHLTSLLVVHKALQCSRYHRRPFFEATPGVLHILIVGTASSWNAMR